MTSSDATRAELGDIEKLFESPAVANALRRQSPTSYAVTADFWRVPFESKHLSLRMKELILLAIHASATALNTEIIDRQVERALKAGATKDDILDVMVSIIALANHALYASVPILEEELKAAGKDKDPLPPPDPSFEKAKENFFKIRKFWNSERDALGRLIPSYFTALTNLGCETWVRGSLTRKERECICVAIDACVTHTFPPGLRTHIRNALQEGATRDELLEVLQLAALMGIEGFVMVVDKLHGTKSGS